MWTLLSRSIRRRLAKALPESLTTQTRQRVAFVEILEPRRLLSVVPDGCTETIIAGGLFSPTAMDLAPDGSGRIFVAEQTGAVRVIKNGALLPTPFATLNVTSFGEHGLLGITFDPDFANNQFVYVCYTVGSTPFHNRVSRFTANGDVAAGAETVLFNMDDLDQNQFFHDGGGMHFGPDGKLYVSTGENEHPENSQSLSNWQGKMLRLNPDGSIPSDNPFFNSASGNNRAIWAYGFRNPFTFAFQPGTGLFYINDVGQDLFEEINEGDAGKNFGWPNQEGGNGAGQSGIVDSIFYYDHGVGNAITGGVFYPGSGSFPAEYQGKYFFADIGGGWIHILDPATHQQTNFASAMNAPVDLDVGDDGALYYLGRQQDGDIQEATGFVAVIRNSVGEAPTITTDPADRTVGKGASASFFVQVTGATPLSYQWRRNGRDIDGATSSSYTVQTATIEDDGARFEVFVSNAFGSDTSNPATLTVIDNDAPVPKILTPVKGTTFFAGQTISYSGKATDPEDGNMSGSRFTWQVDYHTGDIVRPYIQPTTGSRSGTFQIPTITPYTRSNVFYRITLTVVDSAGLSATTSRDIVPLTSDVTVKTNLAGGRIKLDGQDADATTFNGVIGIERQIGVDANQTVNGRNYVFDRWSDGGDLVHAISTPTDTATYTAIYVPAVTNGLRATYFNNKNFTGTQITRTDNTVSFDFGSGSPDALIARDTFSARWNGKFQAAEDDTYTFAIVTDGGVRLRVNGQVVIDALTPKNKIHKSIGSIDLAGGQKYAIILEYVHNTGNAQIELRYSTSSLGQQTIPFGLLYAPITQTTTIDALQDAWVQGGSAADTNFGTSESLLVKNYKTDAYERDTYLQFDFSSVDVLSKVRLRVFGALSSVDNANVPIGVFNAGKSSWDESTITFNNRPALGTKQAEATVSVHTTQQWWEFDLTSLIKAEKANGRNVLTLILRNLQQTSTNTIFAAREAGGNTAQLVITG
ncbi:hypothetical protein BH09PLA1_BH09PLA1_05120 [soil metagenome]